MDITSRKVISLICIVSFTIATVAQNTQPIYPVKRVENPDMWRTDGWNAVGMAKKTKIRKKAKNVILFIGDGMGISTLTAARIFEGQMRGESGEENRLSFEEFPFSALSKTYQVNQQTADSAPTMTSIITGVKTDEGIISVNQNVRLADYTSVAGNETKTLLEYAEDAGKSTGVVSTARLTHATPAACYSHTAGRDWESDADILKGSKPAYDANFPDIARQLLEFKYGDGLEVALGGGRTKFIPKEAVDPEYPTRNGERLDKRDLPQEWQTKYKNSSYVWNKEQFDRVDVKKTDHLLGLFEPSHMKYEHDRLKNTSEEPSLAEMATKSIDLLSRNKRGYVLMVEAGRIDHAHHDGNAYRALRDTVALSDAVRAVAKKVNLDETLIIVTADHSHTLFIQGYPARGNNILGLTRGVGELGELDKEDATDINKKPYTTLGYANGPGARKNERPSLKNEEVLDPDYKQESNIPLSAETHGGEDVAIFAIGPNAHLIRGSMEQNWIFYVMADALRLGRK
ncbi:MAG: alkaline phosphatase [Chloracidobacterium sp.]|nr:alkaline phosphatase [Chloracidobacterium sp.]